MGSYHRNLIALEIEKWNPQDNLAFIGLQGEKGNLSIKKNNILFEQNGGYLNGCLILWIGKVSKWNQDNR